jgi:solute carrier family 35 protein
MSALSDEEKVKPAVKTAVILSYMAVSSLMLMANKLAVSFVPAPATLLLIQFATSAIFAKVMGCCGNEVDKLEWDKVKKFLLVVVTQIGTIFSGMKALQYCNVETFIVFRASMPVVLSVVDYVFLGRSLPTLRSGFMLLGLLLGAVGYALTESGFEVKGYMWIGIWYVIFCIDFAYIKFVVENVKMSTYGRVYYQNFLGSFGFIPIILATQEWNSLNAGMLTDWKPVALVLTTCFLGMGMSTLSYRLRAMVSSTYMAIVGNICKVITVIINFFIWDKHANMYGMIALAVCLVCAYFYDQAPRREDKPPANAGQPPAGANAGGHVPLATTEESQSLKDGDDDDEDDVESGKK